MRVNMSRSIKNLSTHIFSNREFFIDLAKVLGKGAGTIGLLYLASKLNIPVTVSPSGDISTKKSYTPKFDKMDLNIPNIIFSKNAQDSAITTFMQMGSDSDWDSHKIEYVKKIYEIAKEGTDENTRMLAISSINSIVSTMDWESYKKQAVDYIYRLVK